MPGKKQYAFEQFTAVRRYGWGTLSFSPDGSEIAYTVNTSGQTNLWRQSSDGGFPRQMTTFADDTVRVVSWSPDGRWIAFNADHHGDESYQLYLIPAQGGLPQPITNKPGVWHELNPVAWSQNARYLAYNANDRVPTFMDILVYDAKTGETRRVFEGDGYWALENWSPDNRHMIVARANNGADWNEHLLDIRTGETRLLTPHTGDAKYFPGPWRPDASGFYLLTDEGREFVGLAFYHLKSGEKEWIETPEWDIERIAGSDDGRYLGWVVNEDGYSKLHARNLGTGRAISLPDIPRGVIIGLTFSPHGDKCAFLMSTPTHSAEIMVIDLKRRRLTQITDSMLGGIDERDLATPRLVRYSSFDKRRVPAWLYRPHGATAAHRAPAILSIHGGPEAQERPTYMYTGMYQYWTSRGIGVLAPNIRGSTGYGKTYQKLMYHDWGGGDLKDMEAAVLYLRTLDWVDPDRIAIFGASYGGFATLSCVTRLPDYWAAAVDIVGPSNLVTLIKTGPPHWQEMDHATIGNPETEYDFLMERSPITYMERVKAPLYIIQGAQDPRVPKGESDQAVERLRACGVEVQYDVYPDEGHGFTKRENELKAWRDATAFLEKHLLL